MVREDWSADGCHVLCRRLPPDALFVVVHLSGAGVTVSPEIPTREARDLLHACGYDAERIDVLLDEACEALRRLKIAGT